MIENLFREQKMIYINPDVLNIPPLNREDITLDSIPP
jgi:hypothetical protein